MQAIVPTASSLSRKSSFRADVLRLATGTGFAQLIGVLAAPMLTRLYAPEAFGAVALFASISGILGVVACLRCELAIVLPDEEREAANLLGLSLGLALLAAIGAFLLTLALGGGMLQSLGMEVITPFLPLLPVAVGMQGGYSALTYWSTRTRHFSRLSMARVSGAVASTTIMLAGGWLGHATAGVMIGASVSGQVVALLLLGVLLVRDHGVFLAKSIRWREMHAGLRRHRKFPLYSTWTALLNTLSLQFAPLLLVGAYGVAVAGFYSLTLRILSMPSSLVGGAVGNVFFSRAPEARRAGTLAALVMGLHGKLAAVGAPPLVLLMLVGPDLFAHVFGEPWRQAGLYARWMAPWIYLQFLWSPLSTLASVLEIQQAALVAQAATLAARAGALLLCVSLGAGVDAAILSFAAVSALAYLARQLWFLCRAGVNPARVVAHDLREVSLCLLWFWPAVFITWSQSLLVWSLVGAYLLLAWAGCLLRVNRVPASEPST